MKARLTCFVLTALLCGPESLAAQLSCPTTVPVIAFAGKRTETLTVSDFRATTKGYEISIRAIHPPPPARRIIFVLDRSASMARPDMLHLANQAVGDALSAIPADDMVAFLVFAGQYTKQTDFMNLESLKKRLPEILTWNDSKSKGTPLWDNIEHALQILTPHKPGDVIFVISDGDNNSAKLSLEQVESELIRAHVPLLAVAIADPYASGAEERVGPTFLGAFAKATGGVVSQMQEGSIRPGQMILQVEQQYNLELEVTPTRGLTKPAQKIQKWQLSLKSPGNGRSISLSYPSALYPCAATP
jgi:hypothetical protein